MSSSELSQPPTSYTSRLRSKAAKWRESPERLAWIIMLTSFAIFCFLAVTIPVGVNYAMRYAALAQDARLSAITRTTGKVQLYLNARSQPILVRDEQSIVSEGMRIVSLDGAAQGTLEFFDNNDADLNNPNVLGTLQIYSDTDIEVERIRRPLFNSSPEPYYVRLKLNGGQVRVLNNSNDQEPLRIDLLTPQGDVRMQNGSFLVIVEAAKTDVQVRTGQAELSMNNGLSKIVTPNETGTISAIEIISTPTSSGQNWIVNGSFKAPVSDAWLAGPAENVVFPGEVTYVDGDEQQVVQFSQWNADGHSDIGITQVISRDKVLSLESLVLEMDVKILFQSLPGAGQQASEYPIRVEIDFTDAYGKEIKWGYGFYQRELKPDDPFPPPTDNENGRVIHVQQGEWYSFESENLIQLWKSRGTPPERINTIRIYASGHNYQSMVREVYLLAR